MNDLEVEKEIKAKVAAAVKGMSESTWNRLKLNGRVDDYLDALQRQDALEMQETFKTLIDWATEFEEFYKERLKEEQLKQRELSKQSQLQQLENKNLQAQKEFRVDQVIEKEEEVTSNNSTDNSADNTNKKRTYKNIMAEYDFARGRYFIRQANLRHDVRRFREEILQNKLLTPEQAHDFIISTYTRCTPYQDFLEYREIVPTYPIIKDEQNDEVEDKEFGMPTRRQSDDSAEIDISSLLSQQKYAFKEFLDSTEVAYLAYPSSTEEERLFFVYEGSVGDTLRIISIRLAKQYRWRVPDAARFIITGKMPLTNFLTKTYEISDHTDHGFLTIVIKADVLTPAEYVAEIFGKYQRLLLGGENRASDRGTLRMFRFVEEITDRFGVRPGWPTLQKVWNQFYADKNVDKDENKDKSKDKNKDKYYPYPSDMENAYNRTLQALIFPEYIYGDVIVKEKASRNKVSKAKAKKQASKPRNNDLGE